MKYAHTDLSQHRSGALSHPSDHQAVERDTALVKIGTRGTDAAEAAALVARAGGRVVDAMGATMILEITDTPDTVTAFIERLRVFGLIAVTRTGPVVMPRGVSPPAKTARRPLADAPGDEHEDATGWSAYLMPAAATPFTAQADGASDDAAA